MQNGSGDRFTIWLVITFVGGIGVGALIGAIHQGADAKDLQAITLSCITGLAALLAQVRSGQRQSDSQPTGTPEQPLSVTTPPGEPIETTEVEPTP